MKLYLRQIEVGPMGNFVYLVGDPEAKECAMIDPAWDVDRVLRRANSDGMKVTAGFLTHTHFDHANGVEELIRKTGAQIYAHEKEARFLSEFKKHLIETKDGATIGIGKANFKVLHTPGHTEGAQCFLAEGNLFSGDTLFVGACGRCDLPGGDEKKMHASLRRLASLDPATVVYPGHAYGDQPQSTIGREIETNPFMQNLDPA